jgi:hypothetical protein
VSDPVRLRRELVSLLADRSGDASSLDRLCAGAVSALRVDGAAIAVSSDAAVRVYAGASDPITARLDDLQFTFGEGPGWDAVHHRRPVLVADLTGSAGRRWPVFAPAVLAAGFRAVFAFPLQIGAIRLGAFGLLRALPGPLGDDTLADALVVVDVATLTLLDTQADDPALQSSGLVPDALGPYRAEVHQATGMLTVQLGVSAQEALVRLRAHAYAAGQTVDEAARDVVARQLRLDGGPPG